ncbi:hypothetical protein [Archaeoglobus veneficus]|nr:hypothetical protein [Archaeoglobus veneficus]
MAEAGDEIEIDCPKCGSRQKAIVLSKVEKGQRAVMEVKCTKCNVVGRIIKIGELGVEIMDFPPDEGS